MLVKLLLRAQSALSVLVVTGKREDYESRIFLLYLFCNTCNIKPKSEMFHSIFLGLGI